MRLSRSGGRHEGLSLLSTKSSTSPALLLRLLPIKRSFFPDIEETEQQHHNEKCDPQITEPAQFLECYSPGKYERGLHVEDEKKDGHQVKGNGVAKPSGACGDDAALVRTLFFRVWFLFPEPATEEKKDPYQDKDHHKVGEKAQNAGFPGREGVGQGSSPFPWWRKFLAERASGARLIRRAPFMNTWNLHFR